MQFFFSIEQIGISEDETATRIAIYVFAQKPHMIVDDTWGGEAKFTNYTEVQAKVDEMDRKNIAETVGKFRIVIVQKDIQLPVFLAGPITAQPLLIPTIEDGHGRDWK